MSEHVASWRQSCGCSSPVVAHLQLQIRKGRSRLAEQSFAMYMYSICTHYIVNELCVTTTKKKERKNERKKQTNKEGKKEEQNLTVHVWFSPPC